MVESDRIHGAAVAAAAWGCAYCAGLGTFRTRRKNERVCGCVLRRVFRACLHSYGDRWAVDICHPPVAHAEYRADFELSVRGALTDFPLLAELYRLHFVEGLDWRALALRLSRDKGEIYHAIYRLERRVGAELLSNEMYPPANYYATWRPTWRRPARATPKAGNYDDDYRHRRGRYQ